MVDRVRRDQFALLLRRLGTGRMWTDDFDCQMSIIAAETSDETLKQISEEAYCLYSDVWNYRFRGTDKLSEPSRELVARCILLLRSNVECEPSKAPSWFDSNPSGPFGFGDVGVGLLLLTGALLTMVASGLLGIVFTIVMFAIWFSWLHLQHRRWCEATWAHARQKCRWPFATEREFVRTVGTPTFFMGHPR